MVAQLTELLGADSQEARARLELREVITTDMALDVVNLMRESMLDTLTDEFGGIDFGRNHGTSKKGACPPRICRRACACSVLTHDELRFDT